MNDPRTVETVVTALTVGVGGFRGRLRALGIVEVLGFLRGLNRKGLLVCSSEGAEIGLHLCRDKVVQAASTREADRLSEILLRAGLITPAQLDEARWHAAGGERIGRALVASGALTPRVLLEARLRQARQIGLSLFEWTSGQFAFLEGEEAPDEMVPVDLGILDLIVDGIRSVHTVRLFRERMPSPDWILEALPSADRRTVVPLQPQEEYVLHLVDGVRTLGAITALSDFPDLETLRVLFLLLSIGYLKMKALAARDLEDDALENEIGAILDRTNAMLSRVHQYFLREVGPISEDLMAKALREMQNGHPILLSGAVLGGDGTVDGEVLRENLRGLPGARRKEELVQGLNELLYSELLVLRRTLGAEHEGRILRALRPAQAARGAPGAIL